MTSRRPCWRSRTKHFSSLGTKLYFRVNSSRKSSIALTTNTPPTWPPCHVVASQELTNTWGELLIALIFRTLLLYHFLYQLCTIFLYRPIATYLATLWPKEANQKNCPKFPEYNKHPAFVWNWNKDSRRLVNSLWQSNQRQVSVGHSNVRTTTSTRFDSACKESSVR